MKGEGALYIMENILDQVIEYAKRHEGFENLPDEQLEKFFYLYSDTTIIKWDDTGTIKGLFVYQEWPDFLNVIAIIGSGTQAENIRAFRQSEKQLPNKKIGWFDEKKMKARFLKCRQ